MRRSTRPSLTTTINFVPGVPPGDPHERRVDERDI
jgi:hypothetical protein